MDYYENLYFVHPSRWIIYGPSSSGKSTFVKNFLRKLNIFFEREFDKIVYCSDFENFGDFPIEIKDKLIFANDINEELMEKFDKIQNHMLIIDDQMRKVINNELMSDLFTKLSHHLNITVIFITQNLYPKSKFMRDITLNCNYIILMRNPNEKLQIKILSNRIESFNKSRKLIEAYKSATIKPYSYLLIDLCQNTPDVLKYRSEIFNELNTQVIHI